jgi:hypothetical protein
MSRRKQKDFFSLDQRFRQRVILGVINIIPYLFFRWKNPANHIKMDASFGVKSIPTLIEYSLANSLL